MARSEPTTSEQRAWFAMLIVASRSQGAICAQRAQVPHTNLQGRYVAGGCSYCFAVDHLGAPR